MRCSRLDVRTVGLVTWLVLLPGVDAASQARSVSLAGGQVFVETAGQGCAVVLVGGGGSMDLRQWDDIYPRLARSYLLVRYDPRGTGRSDSPREPFSEVEDLGALLDTLGIRRAAVVGLSSGAAIALDFALSAPERVTALILAAPSIPGMARSAEMEERVRGFMRSAEQGAAPYAETLLQDPYFVPAPDNPSARVRARTLIVDNFRPFDPTLIRPLSPPAAGRLAEVHRPVLVLVGRLDHPDVTRRAQELERSIPGSRLEEIPRAGHLLNLENPGALAERVERFLAAALASATGVGEGAGEPLGGGGPGDRR